MERVTPITLEGFMVVLPVAVFFWRLGCPKSGAIEAAGRLGSLKSEVNADDMLEFVHGRIDNV